MPANPPPRHVTVAGFFDRRPWIADTFVLTLLLTLLAWATSAPRWALPTGPLAGAPGWVAGLVSVAMCAPLAVRRVWPVPAAWTMTAAFALSAVLVIPPSLAYVAAPIMVYSVGAFAPARCGRIFLLVGLAGALVMGVALAVLMGAERTPGGRFALDLPPEAIATVVACTVFGALSVGFAWVLGDVRRRRRREIAAVAERSRLLERERERESRLAADAERMRIAREMHDIVAHSMSVMIAQSDGGSYIAQTDPARAQGVFATIGTTGREALAQMRGMLGVLRDDDAARTAPMPALADIPALVADVRAAGLPVSLIGDPGLLAQRTALPASTGLALYRIVQEALTNTMKHAGPAARATVSLRLEPAPATLVVRVDDTGRGAQAGSDGAGSGLSGMAERAQIMGAELAAEARADGFHVELRLPVALEPALTGTGAAAPTGTGAAAPTGPGASAEARPEAAGPAHSVVPTPEHEEPPR
ncbi:histidine kinase [Brevibacterium sp. BRM-1]|uniref:sensor histidine kinase n=1 Tax=Brevibacterium sp. BRM-1 TaxID=2999062 RepID=UPI00227DD163|nr:histidine kinase [Brevibacterium sp. BRM-1]WAL41389.1 histidine kinase [Brevibacterium sp. BRM-1]